MFRLAHELKKHIHEVLGWSGPMTYRQYLAWQAWIDMEWDRPSRSDWYAMQTAAEVQRGYLMNNHLDPSQVREANMKLAFQRSRSAQATLSPDQEAAEEAQFQEWQMQLSKARALAMRGNIVKEVPMPEADLDEQGNPLVEEQPVYVWDGPDTVLQGTEG